MRLRERRSLSRLNRFTVAAYTCLCMALVLVILLGVWGAYRDVGTARETALRNEIATIRSHAVRGEKVGEHHAGVDAEWFEEQARVLRGQILRRWTLVIGGILLVVLPAGASLYYIAYRSAAMRNAAKMVQLQRVTELGQVAAGLAHEIRNPLQAIRLNLHALGQMQNGRAKLSKDAVSTIITESNEEISRLDRLIEELLGFAKPDEAREREVDLTSEIRATLGFVSQELDNSGVGLRTEIADGHVIVRMDASRLRQILLNLLMNAKEAAGENGQIGVGLVCRDERAEIHISDNGPGITMEDRRHIFEPFYTTKESGSGLGLALVKRFVEEADGRIDCQSSGARTTFCVSFPVAGKAK